VGELYAQQIPDVHTPVLQQIEEAFQNGDISREEALLNKFYAAFEPDRLAPAFSGLRNLPVKCLTPAFIDLKQQRPRLSAQTLSAIENMRSSRQDLDREFRSPGGKFLIKYTLSGPDSVSVIDTDNSGVPDYVERAAQFADSSWNQQVEQIGFRDFVLGPDQPYVIRLEDTGNNVFGFTEALSNTTRISVHRNFIGFPPNEDPEGDDIGALKVTIAHEIKHAIQFVANRWRGESANWLEMDAVLMEDIVFDPVDDYFNTITSSFSLFSNPQRSLYPGSYEDVTFALYFSQKWGIPYWVDVWNEISRDNADMVTAMDRSLTGGLRNSSFDREFLEAYLWHAASGSRSQSDFGFSERGLYPDVNMFDLFSMPAGFISERESMERLSAHLYEMEASGSGESLFIALFSENSDVNVGWIVNSGGQTDVTKVVDGSPVQFIKTPAGIQDGDFLTVAVGNSAPLDQAGYRLVMGTSQTIEQLIYGDINFDTKLDSQDVRQLLENRTKRSQIAPDEAFVADVTANDQPTAYDAALMLQNLDGNLTFPADDNENGRGPEPGLFGAGEPVSSNRTGEKQMQAKADAMGGQTETATEDDTLRFTVRVDNDRELPFSSLEAAVVYNPDELSIEAVRLDHSIWPDAVLSWNENPGTIRDTLRIAIANGRDVLEGEIMEVVFAKKTPTPQDSVEILEARIDESPFPLEFDNNNILVDTEETPTEIPNKFELNQNFPNPFNPSTTISYSLPQSETVTLKVYNIVGKEVATLLSDVRQSAGRHQVSFNATDLSSGVYLYRIEAGDFIRTKKMTLIK